MAEFGTKVTELMAPQGAGAQPTSGVQRPINQAAPPAGLFELAGDAALGFAAKQAQGAGNALNEAYIEEATVISNGLATGAINPSDADSRAKALFGKYARLTKGDPKALENLQKASDSLFKRTELSDIEVAVKEQAEFKKSTTDYLRGRGFRVSADMSQSQLDDLIALNAQVMDAENTLKRNYQASQEQRAVAAEGRAAFNHQDQVDRNAQRRSTIQGINTIGSSYFQHALDMGPELLQKIKSGALTHESAVNEVRTWFSQIAGQMAAFETLSPGIQSAWSSAFTQAEQMSLELLSPDADVKALEGRLKTIRLNATMAAMASDPNVLALAISNELFPGTMSSMIASEATFADVFTTLSNQAASLVNPAGIKLGAPIGSKEKDIEVSMIDVARENLKLAQQGAATDPQKAQVANLVGNLMAGLAEADTVDSRTLGDITEFMATPDFGYAIKENMVPADVMAVAKQAWQMSYEKDAIAAVNSFLEGTYFNIAGGISPVAVPSEAPRSYKDIVTPTFQGGGLVLTPNNIDPSTLRNKTLFRDIKRITEGINRVIRAGAHAEGSTDYAAYFEANKERLLPAYFQGQKKSPLNEQGHFDLEAVFSNLIQAESAGRHRDAAGNLLTSSAGAEGVTQVLRDTGADPGFGVKPLQNQSEEEYIRFGRDYLQAMVDEFDGDVAKGVAAYNAGHVSVKNAVKKAREEGRTDWWQFLPKKGETIPYMERILGGDFG